MGQTCDVCGAAARSDEVFVRESITFSRAKVFCPTCHARFSDRFLHGFFALLAICGVTAAIWAAFRPGSVLASRILDFFLLQLFVSAVIIPHELAHAFVARWLGMTVESISIGFGKTISRFRFLGFHCEWNLVPVGGLTLVWPNAKPRLRLRWFLVVSAGPAINALLALIAMQFLEPTEENNWHLPHWNDPVRIFFVANLFVLVENLVPFQYSRGSRVIPSDGLAILRCLAPGAFHPGTQSRAARGWHLVAKILLITIFSVAALFCLGVIFLLIFAARDTMDLLPLLFIIGLFALMATALIYAIYRVCRGQRRAAIPNNVIQLSRDTFTGNS